MDQRTRTTRDDRDRLYVSREKGEEEDLPALRIAQMHQYKDYIKKKAKKD